MVHRVEMDNSVKKYVEETDHESVDMREKHAAVKQVYKDLKESYKSLKKKTEEQQPKRFVFVDSRVKELWTMAQQANMTEDELSSFKVSLTFC